MRPFTSSRVRNYSGLLSFYKVKDEYDPVGHRKRRSSFFNSWEKYTEAENDEYCRLNNRTITSEPKNVMIIDLDEYEEELVKQQVKSKQRAKQGEFKSKLQSSPTVC